MSNGKPKNVVGADPNNAKFVNDPTKVTSGEEIDIKYTYEIKYIETLEFGSDGDPFPFSSRPEEIQKRQIAFLLEQGIDIKNKTKKSLVSMTGNIRDERENKTPLYIDEPLSDKEIDEFLNPPTPQSNFTRIEMVVVVGNNAGLPTYTLTGGELTGKVGSLYPGKEEQALRLAEQMFKQNPPKMTIPGADIYTIDEETGEILVDEDWYGQQYPPEGALVSFVSDLEPLPYSFSSRVVDEVTNEPLMATLVEDLDGRRVYTDAQGYFTIKGSFIPGEIQQLTITGPSGKKDYKIATVPITTQEGNLRDDINYITLSSSSADLSAAKLKAKSTPESEIQRLQEEKNKSLIGSIIKKAIDEIQNRLNPFIIEKLLQKPFGITDPIELIKKAKKQLEIRKKNKTKISEDYFNMYEFDPNYNENQRRIKENDFPTDDLELLPVPTPGYVYNESINRWVSPQQTSGGGDPRVSEAIQQINSGDAFNFNEDELQNYIQTQADQGRLKGEPGEEVTYINDFTFDTSTATFQFPTDYDYTTTGSSTEPTGSEILIPPPIIPPPPRKEKWKIKWPKRKFKTQKSPYKSKYLKKGRHRNKVRTVKWFSGTRRNKF